jgi:hypothetical protein
MQHTMAATRVYIILNLLFALFSTCARADSNNEENPIIVDASKSHNFISIGDLYTDGKNKYLCVGTPGKKFSLWNPVSDIVSVSTQIKGCEIRPDLRLMNPLVGPQPLKGLTNQTNKDVGFGSDAMIYSISAQNCSPNFTNYFKLKYKSGDDIEFFIISRVKAPVVDDIGEYCEYSNGTKWSVTEKFRDIWNLASIDLGNGRSLLYSYDNSLSQPVLLIVRGIPKKLWSSNGNIFIVPKELLAPKLDKASNIIGRYKAVLAVIGQH